MCPNANKTAILAHKLRELLVIQRVGEGEEPSSSIFFSILLDPKNAGIQRARLMLDVAAGELEVYRLSDQHLEAAELLIGRHSFTRRLRTLDALQLAIALDLSRQYSLDHFVVADKSLAEIASLEGLMVINPEIV